MGRRRPTVKYEHLLRFVDRSHLIDQFQFVATEDSNRLDFTCQLGCDAHWAKVCAVLLGASAGSQLVIHSPQCTGAKNHVMLGKGRRGIPSSNCQLQMTDAFFIMLAPVKQACQSLCDACDKKYHARTNGKNAACKWRSAC